MVGISLNASSSHVVAVYVWTYQVIEDLLANDANHIEALLVSYTIHNHVSMDTDELSAVQDCVLVLSCCVDDFGCIVLVLVTDDLGKGVFNGRIVSVDEVTVDKLNCEGALACTCRQRLCRHASASSSSMVEWKLKS